MIPNWPGNLPYIEIAGYASGMEDLLLRSPMEVGPDKVRRRNTAGVRPVNGNLTVDSAELETLRSFYKDSTLSGAIRFAWTEPETGNPVEMRFTSPPNWTPLGAGIYKVSLRLEILP
jgi:hypothetical protein